MTIPVKRVMRGATTAPMPQPKKKFGIITGKTRTTFLLGLFSREGLGKSTLMGSCPGIVVADIENSMQDIDCKKVTGIETFQDLRDWVRQCSNGIFGIDSITRAEKLAEQFVIQNKTMKNGVKAGDSIEDFGYSAATFLNDEFRRLLMDIEESRKRGCSWVMTAHEHIKSFKNPDGSNYLRYEPKLFENAQGTVSNTSTWVQFLDHLGFISLDTSVERGKATGSGSRCIYFEATPARMCKARGIETNEIVFTPGTMELWDRLGVTTTKE